MRRRSPSALPACSSPAVAVAATETVTVIVKKTSIRRDRQFYAPTLAEAALGDSLQRAGAREGLGEGRHEGRRGLAARVRGDGEEGRRLRAGPRRRQGPTTGTSRSPARASTPRSRASTARRTRTANFAAVDRMEKLGASETAVASFVARRQPRSRGGRASERRAPRRGPARRARRRGRAAARARARRARSTCSRPLGTVVEHQDAIVKTGEALRKGFADLTPQEEYYLGRAVAARILGQYRPLDDDARTALPQHARPGARPRLEPPGDLRRLALPAARHRRGQRLRRPRRLRLRHPRALRDLRRPRSSSRRCSRTRSAT